jgi:hypothetical protein
VGIFGKKPRIEVCEMCGKSALEGCGLAHKHVEQISADQPAWLPSNYRAQAPGEYTWLCVRCNAFPAMKWPRDGGAFSGMQLHLGKDHHVGMFAAGGTSVNFSMIPAPRAAPEPAPTPAAAPAPAPATSAAPAASAVPATSEEEMTKEMAYSLAAMCEEASRLYDECIDKADKSERARAMSQTDYVNGVQQHHLSKQSFAGMADRLEGELTSLLKELHELSAKGERTWSDFMFLAGGPNSDFSTAMLWCAQHGIDSSSVSTIAVQGLFLRCDFGLTKASFLKENDRLNAALESNRQ